MIKLEWIQSFVMVVKQGSFTKAAAHMRIPKSTVSKAISALERETGCQLLVRTTREQTLTAIGKKFYDECVGPLQRLELAYTSLSAEEQVLSGTLKLTAPEDLGTEVLASCLGKLTQQYPKLNFELLLTDEVLDLVKDGIDLAIRIGPLKESGLKVKRVGEIKLILVASANYLRQREKISTPDQLLQCSCLALGPRKMLRHSRQWPLKSSLASLQIPIQPRLVGNQMSSLLRAAMVDAGIALVPSFLAKKLIEEEKLVRVLPQWSSPGLPVSLLSPFAFSSSARLRAVTDFLFSELQKAIAAKV